MIPTAYLAERIVTRCEADASEWAARPRLDFRTLRDLTDGLSGPERLAVFGALPEELQEAAWASLAYEMSQVDYWERGGAEIARNRPRETRKRRSTGDPVAFDKDAKDPLLTIEPRDYVEALSGVEVGEWGTVRCPLPGHDQERTGSFKCYPTPERGWRCFGCDRGGSIFDFGAHLWSMPTRGRAFRELRQRLREELGVT